MSDAGPSSTCPSAVDGSRRTALCIVLMLLLAGILSLDSYKIVWRSGAFSDSDDAMRAVQLRDFLAGQDWSDLVNHRLDPPTGQSTHWSRVVDVALAGPDRLLAVFLPSETAERVMRLVFPAALLACLLALSNRLGRLLAGPDAGLAAIWLVTLSGPMFIQFAPGRIDHHAPQIVLLIAAFLLLAQGFDRRQARRLAIAATLMALSLSISLENLPFFAPMTASLLALFILDGARARPQLVNFAAGALFAAPLLYVATVPGADAFPSACDAFSFVHLAAFMMGALLLLGLAQASPRLTTPRRRAVAALVAALVAAATVLLIAPHCAGDPLAGVDPLIRKLWLSQVRESQPLSRAAAAAPEVAVAVGAPVAMGLAAAFFFARRASGLTRRRWLLAAATIAVGAAAGLWQVRVFTSVTPLAMVPLAAIVALGGSRLSVTPALRAALGAVALYFVSPIGLVSTLPSRRGAAPPGEAVCFTPEAMAPLARLPAARVVSSFNLGPFILAQTAHSVFAAPYHRNNHGNRVAVDILLAPPERAEALARAAGVGLIAWCAHPENAGPGTLAEAAPGGLAAMLDRGETPPWLEKKSAAGDPLLVFAVRRME